MLVALAIAMLSVPQDMSEILGKSLKEYEAQWGVGQKSESWSWLGRRDSPPLFGRVLQFRAPGVASGWSRTIDASWDSSDRLQRDGLGQFSITYKDAEPLTASFTTVPKKGLSRQKAENELFKFALTDRDADMSAFGGKRSSLVTAKGLWYGGVEVNSCGPKSNEYELRADMTFLPNNLSSRPAKPFVNGAYVVVSFNGQGKAGVVLYRNLAAASADVALWMVGIRSRTLKKGYDDSGTLPDLPGWRYGWSNGINGMYELTFTFDDAPEEPEDPDSSGP